jgi:hypothetical protein
MHIKDMFHKKYKKLLSFGKTEYDSSVSNDILVFMDITNKVKAIFGDVVVSAKQCVYVEHYPPLSRSTTEHISSIIDRIALNNETFIDLEDGEVEIIFTSGKTVNIQTSEWGRIDLVNKEGS